MNASKQARNTLCYQKNTAIKEPFFLNGGVAIGYHYLIDKG